VMSCLDQISCFTSHGISRIRVTGLLITAVHTETGLPGGTVNKIKKIKIKKKSFGECYTCFGFEIKTGVKRILAIFRIRSSGS